MGRPPPLATICMVSALGVEVPGSVVSTREVIFLVVPPICTLLAAQELLRLSRTTLRPAAPVGGAHLGRAWGLGVFCFHSYATGGSAPRGKNSTPTSLFLASPIPLFSRAGYDGMSTKGQFGCVGFLFYCSHRNTTLVSLTLGFLTLKSTQLFQIKSQF